MPLLLLLLAQSPPRTTFTLPEALAFAKAHQPQIAEAVRRVAVEQRAAAVPRAGWYPLITAGAELLGGTVNQTTASFFAVPGLAVPRISGVPATRVPDWQPSPSSLAGISVRQEIFEFGKYAARAAVEDALADAAKANADLVELDVRYAVEEAYCAVLAAKAIVQASEDAFTRARVHRDLAQAGVKSGLREPIGLTRAEAELSRIDAGRIRAHGGLETAWVTLAATMGAPEMEVDVGAQPGADALQSVTAGLDRAQRSDPRVRWVAARLHSQALETKAVWADYRPDFFLQADAFAYAGGGIPSGNQPQPIANGWLPTVPNYAISLMLRIPVLDVGIIAQSRVSRAREEVVRSELSVAQQQLDAAVRQAYVSRDVAEAALPSLAHSLRAAQDNWAQADARFRAGLGTSVEIADAEALREDAEIQLALGQFNLARAGFAVARAIGVE